MGHAAFAGKKDDIHPLFSVWRTSVAPMMDRLD
jgi:hypothetical protein